MAGHLFSEGKGILSSSCTAREIARNRKRASYVVFEQGEARTMQRGRLRTGLIILGWNVAVMGFGQTPERIQSLRRALYHAALEREIFENGGARVLGLASSGVALDDESQGLFWNPATLASRESVALSLSDEPFASRGQREGSFALSGNLTSWTKDPIGSFGLASWGQGWEDPTRHRMFVFGYASPREEGLAFGVGMRSVRRVLGGESFSGTGMDGGLHYRYEVGNGNVFLAGISATHFGMRLTDRNRQAMPQWMSSPLVRLGIAYRWRDHAVVTTQLTYAHDTLRLLENRYRWHIGFEQGFLQNRFVLRTGYMSTLRRGHIERGLWAFGASARMGLGQVDYAFVTGGDGLGGNLSPRHLLSMSVAWEGVSRVRPASPRTTFVSAEPPQRLTFPTANPYVTIQNEVFSPNGDGRKDTVTFVLNRLPATWRFEIADAHHEVVYVHRGTSESASVELEWDGKDQGHRPVPEGLYSWRLLDESRETETIAKGVVTVDQTPPALVFVSDPLVLVKGKASSAVRFRMRADEANLLSSWELRVSDDETVWLATKGQNRMPSGFVWRNWRDVVDDGAAPKVEIAATDEAGNDAHQTFLLPVLDLRKVSGKIDARGIVIPVTDALFVKGSDQLREEAQRLIQQLAVAMRSATNLRLTIEQGVNPVSRVASKGRIETLRSAFQRAGVDVSRLGIRAGAEEGMRMVLSGRPELPPSTLTRTPPKTGPLPEPQSPVPSVMPLPALVEPLSPEVASTPSHVRYSVLVGSFRDEGKAVQLAREVARLQIGAPVRVERALLDSGIWFRVLVGEFSDRESAASTHQTVKERVNANAILFAANPN